MWIYILNSVPFLDAQCKWYTFKHYYYVLIFVFTFRNLEYANAWHSSHGVTRAGKLAGWRTHQQSPHPDRPMPPTNGPGCFYFYGTRPGHRTSSVNGTGNGNSNGLALTMAMASATDGQVCFLLFETRLWHWPSLRLIWADMGLAVKSH